MTSNRILVATALSAALLASAASAQTKEATRTKYVPPTYPEAATKNDVQGNVVLIGKIDAKGRVVDLQFLEATQSGFVDSAVAAVQAWEFQPAVKDGKPIETALNVAVRFRKTGPTRGKISRPMLGDLQVFPADAAGKRTAPDGFPLKKGKDAGLRIEVQMDVPPTEQARTLAVEAEAVSPKGRKLPLFTPPISIPALSTGVNFPIVAQVGQDWEDGVWLLRFTVEGQEAGAGQFWIAANPDTFPFVIPRK